jgi:hypothetical protein
MMSAPSIVDGVLVQWGERLFYLGNRIVRSDPMPRLTAFSVGQRAAAVRARLEATVRRAPQVMVKVSGGGRGMKAIAAHFRYIAKGGRVPIEDDRGVVQQGKEELRDLVEQWRYGGSEIAETSPRREAFNLVLSMPRGTDPLIVQRAAREFAQDELADHRYVMVLHEHQANPHVHLTVRAESRRGRRLNPRKADLQRWRETFAEKLRGWGIAAEATRQATRGENRNFPSPWQLRAEREGRLRTPLRAIKTSAAAKKSRVDAIVSWAKISYALEASGRLEDRRLVDAIASYVNQMPVAIARRKELDRERQRDLSGLERTPSPRVVARDRGQRDIERMARDRGQRDIER